MKETPTKLKQKQVEEWRDIPSFPKYQVSNLGRIKSAWGRSGVVFKTASKNKVNGYYSVALYTNNRVEKRRYVHRLVAEAFIPNQENKPHVNHIIPDLSLNTVSNLEWCTQKENIHHSIKLGNLNCIGERNPCHKLTTESVSKIRALLKEGRLNQREIGTLFNVTQTSVSRIKLGVAWGNSSITEQLLDQAYSKTLK